ncbi:hypothetical protein CDL12_05708 [Handroanthus impetiginosus]|uniref:Uncharacterized protein n=1 Tax=Handroanthus impetiginosus TaxID=429701 RepID=A0A2G9HVP7_9LAMI|nr:hypothetical protein CDL12_05708 [Handroanthus impetiginosus]
MLCISVRTLINVSTRDGKNTRSLGLTLEFFSGENSSAHKRSTPEKLNSCRQIKNFLPPLTTIRGGANSLKVSCHREGGLLIIEASRLKLRFLRGFNTAASGEKEVENGECGEETTTDEEIEELINEFELEKEEFDGEMKVEMRIEKLQRVRKCHRNRGFFNSDLKPTLWVATS